MSQKSKTTFDEAINIARTEDVTSTVNSIVLYSVSYLPTKQNKIDALKYINKTPNKMLIDDTKCGKKLIELGLDDGTSGLTADEVANVWKIASERFVSSAKGDVVAFVSGADPKSVFITTELPAIIRNPKIKTINGLDKNSFY